MPLDGRVVTIEGRRTTTDAQGKFSLDSVAPAYDLYVTEPDGSAITVYKDLRRRDPLVAHQGTPVAPYTANVHGSVAWSTSGDPPEGNIQISFFSPAHAGEGRASLQTGPKYGPLELSWYGTEEISGHLFAVQKTRLCDIGSSADAGSRKCLSKWWIAHEVFTLRPGGDVARDLRLEPAPVARLGVRVQADEGIQNAALNVDYRLDGPDPGIVVGGGRARNGERVEIELPDLSGHGARLCVTAARGASSSSRCGLKTGDEIVLALHGPPVLTHPTECAVILPSTVFAWKEVERGVYLLKLEDGAVDLRLVTTGTMATWSELGSIGAEAWAGPATSQASAEWLGPFATMDEAAGPIGLGADQAPEFSRSSSSETELTVPRTEPPLTGSCSPRNRIDCGEGQDGRERYDLRLINEFLQNYPRFAKAAEIRCVRDCKQARRFMKTKNEYLERHGKIDMYEPLRCAAPGTWLAPLVLPNAR